MELNDTVNAKQTSFNNTHSKFLSKSFLFTNNTAEYLYYTYAANLPIIDYHNHLPVDEIASNKKFEIYYRSMA